MSIQDIKKRRKFNSSTKVSDNEISLTSLSAMGGIIGGRGYDFQTRYIVCQIPNWLAKVSFTQLFHEGTGDVDNHYGNIKKEVREHIQVKDHQVTVSEFKVVIQKFVEIDKGMPEIYERFIVACPSLGLKVKSLEEALKRLRNAKPFYESKPSVLKKTENDVRKIIKDIGLAQYHNFILSKVHFEIGLCDFHNDESTCDKFKINLLKLSQYKQNHIDTIDLAYNALIREITNSRGKTLHRRKIEALISSALRGNKEKLKDAIGLDIHNWTLEKYDRKPQYTLDWSAYFDRTTRKIPQKTEWNEVLLPELHQLRKQIVSNTSTRLIRFRGKCCLSTCIAVGAVFPSIGSWIFEVVQLPSSMTWRSDAVPEIHYRLNVDELDIDSIKLDSRGDSIVMVLNVTGNALVDVVKYINSTSLKVKKIILVQPSDFLGSLSISNDSEAVSFAITMHDRLKKVLIKYGVHFTHLFFYGPFALGLFLGQHLTSVGQIQLYEFTDPGYVPSFTLRT